MRSAVEQEIRDLIQKRGPITFARFMQASLYSPRGGFYSARGDRISSHFRTSATMHPVFGALIARQLVQMWQILGNPPVFHVIEVGSGDGALARSITDACRSMEPAFSHAVRYVAADYTPGWFDAPSETLGWVNAMEYRESPGGCDTAPEIHPVKAVGISAFRNIVGCILSNELIDNFPVHRFVIQEGRVKEVLVTMADGEFTEVTGEPSSPAIEERLDSLGLSLPDGYRGEVNLALGDWAGELSRALDRGFVLTIDYGEPAPDLYSPENAQGTLVCFNRHAVGSDPYRDIGRQDITSQVDFTSLIQAGERHGLATVGYARQSRFLTNLGFRSFLDGLQRQGMSAAREELNRMAMMTLVDPEEYGNFKVLAQAKGIDPGVELPGFADSNSDAC